MKLSQDWDIDTKQSKIEELYLNFTNINSGNNNYSNTGGTGKKLKPASDQRMGSKSTLHD